MTLQELERKLIAEEQKMQEEEEVFDRLEASQRSWKPTSKVLLAELILLALIVGSFAGVWYWRNNPERIAGEYVQGAEQGEWNDVYDKLYFGEEKNPFLSKKMFVSAQSLAFDQSSVVRTKVRSVKRKGKKGVNAQTMEVRYTRNGAQVTKAVPLIRRGGRWLVDGTEQYVKENVRLEVPKGTLVVCDEALLDNALLMETKGNRETYEIPKMFDGVHYLSLEKTDMDPLEKLIRFSEEETVKLYMKYNRQTLEKAVRQAGEDIRSGYLEAAQNSESGREFERLNLTKNRIGVRVTDDLSGLIEVKTESYYEYQFSEKQWFFASRKTERGQCSNICIYSYDSGELKLESRHLNTTFL